MITIKREVEFASDQWDGVKGRAPRPTVLLVQNDTIVRLTVFTVFLRSFDGGCSLHDVKVKASLLARAVAVAELWEQQT